MSKEWMYVYAYDRNAGAIQAPARWSKHRASAAAVTQITKLSSQGFNIRVWLGGSQIPPNLIDGVIEAARRLRDGDLTQDPITKFLDAKKETLMPRPFRRAFCVDRK